MGKFLYYEAWLKEPSSQYGIWLGLFWRGAVAIPHFRQSTVCNDTLSLCKRGTSQFPLNYIFIDRDLLLLWTSSRLN